MTVLNILIAPHPILSTKSARVTVFDDNLRQRLNDMTETMYADKGIGLAANQVGILKRIIVMNIGNDNSLTSDATPIKPQLFYLINPEIEWASDEKVIFEEGCLSVPGQGVPVERSASIRLRYQDETGKEKIETFHGLQARCILHEVDHINGKTMLDYLSKLKKDLAIRKIVKHY
ncbi:MAG: peptide deformylase, partial [Alphaproteobacteria bacterium]|nr:peptide deformylase [Alphaproteobacteria bacterium]